MRRVGVVRAIKGDVDRRREALEPPWPAHLGKSTRQRVVGNDQSRPTQRLPRQSRVAALVSPCKGQRGQATIVEVAAEKAPMLKGSGRHGIGRRGGDGRTAGLLDGRLLARNVG